MLKTIVGAERAEILVEWSSEWALQIVMEQEQNGGKVGLRAERLFCCSCSSHMLWCLSTTWVDS